MKKNDFASMSPMERALFTHDAPANTSMTTRAKSGEDDKMRPISPPAYTPPDDPRNAPQFTGVTARVMAMKTKASVNPPVTPEQASKMSYTDLALTAKGGKLHVTQPDPGKFNALKLAMNTVVLLAALLLFSHAASAQLPEYNIFTRFTLSTNTLWGASSTFTFTNITTGVRDYKEYAIQITGTLSNSGTSGVLFNFKKTLDNTVYETTPSVTGVLTMNGTNPVSTVINVTGDSSAAIKLDTGVNSNSVGLATLTVKVSTKTSRIDDKQ